MNHLEELFSRGHRWLVCTGRQAWMAGKDSVFQRRGGHGPAAFLILDLEESYERFQLLAGEDAYTLAQLAALANVAYSTVRVWADEAVLVPSIRDCDGPGRGRERLFSKLDAFSCCVAGTLRRGGMKNLGTLRKVTAFLSGRESLVSG
jgi:hypothetical protein